MSSNKNKTVGLMQTLAVMSVFFLGQIGMLLTPALAGIATLYPDHTYNDITYVVTLASFAQMFSCILTGAIVGKKISYKAMAILGSGIVVVAGTAGYFCTTFTALMISRFIYGLGAGIGLALGGAYVNAIWKGQKAADMQGYGNVVLNASTIAYQLLAGAVCVVNVRATFLLHLIIAIPLILCAFFAPQPDSTPDEDAVAEMKAVNQPKVKEKIPVRAWIVLICNAVTWIFFMPILNLPAAIISNENLGTSVTASIVGIMYTIAGVLMGAVFGKLFKTLKGAINPVAHVLWIGGLFLTSQMHSVVGLCAGVLIAGLGWFIVWPATVMFMSTIPESKQALGISLFSAGISIGAFISTSFCTFVEKITGDSNPRLALLYGVFGMIICSVIWLITLAGNKKKAVAESAA